MAGKALEDPPYDVSRRVVTSFDPHAMFFIWRWAVQHRPLWSRNTTAWSNVAAGHAWSRPRAEAKAKRVLRRLERAEEAARRAAASRQVAYPMEMEHEDG